ncbi:MAG: hypothetical protein A2Y72_03240 [Chloroflexi bacterium RBG_13_53_26]|nr:MAG: hypothetical protein A2Y72_03240 [Chloroflexi bacterium RBG_13_53_26]
MNNFFDEKLKKLQPVDLSVLLRRTRREVIAHYLELAGQVCGFRVHHVAFLLGTTERTIRNWIIETDMARFFFAGR